jgi:hypothetical protein
MLGFWRELTDASRDCRDAAVSACRQRGVHGRQSERWSLATATVVDWAETTSARAGLSFPTWDHGLVGAAVGILPTFVSTSPARRPPASEARRPDVDTQHGLASVAPPPRSGRGADSLPTPARLLLHDTLLPLSCDVAQCSPSPPSDKLEGAPSTSGRAGPPLPEPRLRAAPLLPCFSAPS